MTLKATRPATSATIDTRAIEPAATDCGVPIVHPTFEHAVFAIDCLRHHLAGADGRPLAVADIEIDRATDRVAALVYRLTGREWLCVGFRLPVPIEGAFPFGWYENRALELLDELTKGH